MHVPHLGSGWTDAHGRVHIGSEEMARMYADFHRSLGETYWQTTSNQRICDDAMEALRRTHISKKTGAFLKNFAALTRDAYSHAHYNVSELFYERRDLVRMNYWDEILAIHRVVMLKANHLWQHDDDAQQLEIILNFVNLYSLFKDIAEESFVVDSYHRAEAIALTVSHSSRSSDADKRKAKDYFEAIELAYQLRHERARTSRDPADVFGAHNIGSNTPSIDLSMLTNTIDADDVELEKNLEENRQFRDLANKLRVHIDSRYSHLLEGLNGVDGAKPNSDEAATTSPAATTRSPDNESVNADDDDADDDGNGSSDDADTVIAAPVVHKETRDRPRVSPLRIQSSSTAIGGFSDGGPAAPSLHTRSVSGLFSAKDYFEAIELAYQLRHERARTSRDPADVFSAHNIGSNTPSIDLSMLTKTIDADDVELEKNLEENRQFRDLANKLRVHIDSRYSHLLEGLNGVDDAKPNSDEAATTSPAATTRSPDNESVNADDDDADDDGNGSSDDADTVIAAPVVHKETRDRPLRVTSSPSTPPEHASGKFVLPAVMLRPRIAEEPLATNGAEGDTDADSVAKNVEVVELRPLQEMDTRMAALPQFPAHHPQFVDSPSTHPTTTSSTVREIPIVFQTSPDVVNQTSEGHHGQVRQIPIVYKSYPSADPVAPARNRTARQDVLHVTPELPTSPLTAGFASYVRPETSGSSSTTETTTTVTTSLDVRRVGRDRDWGREVNIDEAIERRKSMADIDLMTPSAGNEVNIDDAIARLTSTSLQPRVVSVARKPSAGGDLRAALRKMTSSAGGSGIQRSAEPTPFLKPFDPKTEFERRFSSVSDTGITPKPGKSFFDFKIPIIGRKKESKQRRVQVHEVTHVNGNSKVVTMFEEIALENDDGQRRRDSILSKESTSSNSSSTSPPKKPPRSMLEDRITQEVYTVVESTSQANGSPNQSTSSTTTSKQITTIM